MARIPRRILATRRDLQSLGLQSLGLQWTPSLRWYVNLVSSEIVILIMIIIAIIHGHSLFSPLLVIITMPFNNILRKFAEGNKFTKSQTHKKKSTTSYTWVISRYLPKNKSTGDSDTKNKNIQPRYRNGILHRKMCYDHNEKWEKINNGRKKTSKLEKNQNAWREEEL